MLLLVEGPQYANLVVLVLVEIEAVQMSIPELEEVVIKTLFGDANVFGCLLERDSLLGVHAAPLGDFNHDFAYDALFFTA